MYVCMIVCAAMHADRGTDEQIVAAPFRHRAQGDVQLRTSCFKLKRRRDTSAALGWGSFSSCPGHDAPGAGM